MTTFFQLYLLCLKTDRLEDLLPLPFPVSSPSQCLSFKLPTDRDYLQLPRVRIHTRPSSINATKSSPDRHPRYPRKKQCGSWCSSGPKIWPLERIRSRMHASQSNQDPCGSAYTTRTRIAGDNSTAQQLSRRKDRKKGRRSSRPQVMCLGLSRKRTPTTALIGFALLVAGLLSSFLRISTSTLLLTACLPGMHLLLSFRSTVPVDRFY